MISKFPKILNFVKKYTEISVADPNNLAETGSDIVLYAI